MVPEFSEWVKFIFYQFIMNLIHGFRPKFTKKSFFLNSTFYKISYFVTFYPFEGFYTERKENFCIFSIIKTIHVFYISYGFWE